jgi:hypothetical protein
VHLRPVSLPENRSLPSVKLFAECFFRALGKEALYRVLESQHSAKKKTLGEAVFTECFLVTLGKEIFQNTF